MYSYSSELIALQCVIQEILLETVLFLLENWTNLSLNTLVWEMAGNTRNTWVDKMQHEDTLEDRRTYMYRQTAKQTVTKTKHKTTKRCIYLKQSYNSFNVFLGYNYTDNILQRHINRKLLPKHFTTGKSQLRKNTSEIRQTTNS